MITIMLKTNFGIRKVFEDLVVEYCNQAIHNPSANKVSLKIESYHSFLKFQLTITGCDAVDEIYVLAEKLFTDLRIADLKVYSIKGPKTPNKDKLQENQYYIELVMFEIIAIKWRQERMRKEARQFIEERIKSALGEQNVAFNCDDSTQRLEILFKSMQHWSNFLDELNLYKCKYTSKIINFSFIAPSYIVHLPYSEIMLLQSDISNYDDLRHLFEKTSIKDTCFL